MRNVFFCTQLGFQRIHPTAMHVVQPSVSMDWRRVHPGNPVSPVCHLSTACFRALRRWPVGDFITLHYVIVRISVDVTKRSKTNRMNRAPTNRHGAQQLVYAKLCFFPWVIDNSFPAPKDDNQACLRSTFLPLIASQRLFVNTPENSLVLHMVPWKFNLLKSINQSINNNLF